MKSRLTGKELDALKLLEKFGVIDAGVMAEIENGVDKSVTRKRLAKLQKEGYADYLMYEGRKMYYATARGLSAIGSWRKPYRGKSGTTWHAVCIGIVAAWMRQEYEVCISEIETDRTLPKKERHLPDLVARNVAVEIELTQKTKKRLEANIISNGIRYGAQIWIIPKMRVSLSGEIKKQAEMFGYEAYIYHIEEVEEAVRTKVYGGDYSLVHIAPKEVLS